MDIYIKKALKLRRWVMIGHHIPGRIRLKYKLGLVAQFATMKTNDIEQTLASIPAFKNYTLNSATGSIVIEYDPQIIKPQWVDALFSPSPSDAEQACYAIAQRLRLDGVIHE